MVGREYSADNSKTLEISIGAVMKNLEMLRFAPDHFKTKEMPKNAANAANAAICNKVCC